jgi:hypothetical protein
MDIPPHVGLAAKLAVLSTIKATVAAIMAQINNLLLISLYLPNSNYAP